MREVTNALELNPRVGAHVLEEGAIREPLEQKTQILKYLKSFESDAVGACVVYDSVKNEHTSITLEEFNDGEFYWNSSVVYYFENYDIQLEKAFIEKVLEITSV